jgi:hypothetical protein
VYIIVSFVWHQSAHRSRRFSLLITLFSLTYTHFTFTTILFKSFSFLFFTNSNSILLECLTSLIEWIRIVKNFSTITFNRKNPQNQPNVSLFTISFDLLFCRSTFLDNVKLRLLFAVIVSRSYEKCSKLLIYFVFLIIIILKLVLSCSFLCYVYFFAGHTIASTFSFD